MALDGYATYQQNQLLTASPAKLLLAAYDGAIRFSRIGCEKMKEDKFDEQSLYINKALAIVCELMSTLKEDVEPTLTTRLKSLYTYVIEKLYKANLEQDQNAINEAVKILSQLREAWAEAEKNLIQHQITEEAA